MTLNELKSYRVGLFADRSSLNEALDYATDIAKSTDAPAAVLTAVYVVLNTVIRNLEGEKE
jgi:hypothetical protein